MSHLPFNELLKAQRICKMTRDVTADSKRLRGGHCVFTSHYHNLRPFKSVLDFDTAYSLQPTDKPARYVDKGAGLVGGGSFLDLQYGIERGAHISTSFGAGLARLHKARERRSAVASQSSLAWQLQPRQVMRLLAEPKSFGVTCDGLKV